MVPYCILFPRPLNKLSSSKAPALPCLALPCLPKMMLAPQMYRILLPHPMLGTPRLPGGCRGVGGVAFWGKIPRGI